jgi:hypothetical protein
VFFTPRISIIPPVRLDLRLAGEDLCEILEPLPVRPRSHILLRLLLLRRALRRSNRVDDASRSGDASPMRSSLEVSSLAESQLSNRPSFTSILIRHQRPISSLSPCTDPPKTFVSDQCQRHHDFPWFLSVSPAPPHAPVSLNGRTMEHVVQRAAVKHIIMTLGLGRHVSRYKHLSPSTQGLFGHWHSVFG